MTSAFADSSFFLAYLSADDEHHEAASHIMKSSAFRLVTTGFVLLEVSAGLARPPGRARCIAFLNAVRAGDVAELIPVSQALFDSGFSLYAKRPDKGWSLVDCISFVTMKSRKLRVALTADVHFVQAGFQTPMRSG